MSVEPISPPLLQMSGITKRYPGVVANHNISLDVKAGEIHALLGENGAGKTTLMNILFGLARPDEGQILLDGLPVQIADPPDLHFLGSFLPAWSDGWVSITEIPRKPSMITFKEAVTAV